MKPTRLVLLHRVHTFYGFMTVYKTASTLSNLSSLLKYANCGAVDEQGRPFHLWAIFNLKEAEPIKTKMEIKDR